MPQHHPVGRLEVRYEWKTEHVLYLELQEPLNRLSENGWDVFSVPPMGDIPDRCTVAQRIGGVYFVITARRFTPA